MPHPLQYIAAQKREPLVVERDRVVWAELPAEVAPRALDRGGSRACSVRQSEVRDDVRGDRGDRTFREREGGRGPHTRAARSRTDHRGDHPHLVEPVRGSRRSRSAARERTLDRAVDRPGGHHAAGLRARAPSIAVFTMGNMADPARGRGRSSWHPRSPRERSRERPAPRRGAGSWREEGLRP